jgi:hypothetical protein
MLTAPLPDPFRERSPAMGRRFIHLLGSRVEFKSNSGELLRLVDAAYQNLPRHRLAARAPDLSITLWLSPPASGGLASHQPPPLELVSGAGLIGAATGSSNFLMLAPAEHAAVVVVSPDMLRFPYHTRYELIEFAVFTLAARVQRLVPLHGACVGKRGRGILLLGDSGAGKSTVALQCALAGFDFLTEDAVFVNSALMATGVPNFFHLRADSLQWVDRAVATMIRRSPVIRRRSGVEKFELDLRKAAFRLSPSLKIAAVAFLTRRRGGQSLLRPLPKAQLLDRIRDQQAYGAGQLQWRQFIKNAARVPAFELYRGRHPREAADALAALL